LNMGFEFRLIVSDVSSLHDVDRLRLNLNLNIFYDFVVSYVYDCKNNPN